MPSLLDDQAVAAALAELAHWSGDRREIRRTAELPSFRDAITVVDRVADAAEQRDHHPDIDIRWRTLHFTLSTHSAGGITDLDLDLARRIDEIVAGVTGSR